MERLRLSRNSKAILLALQANKYPSSIPQKICIK